VNVRLRPIATAVLLLTFMLSPRTALAHGHLEHSDPAAGDTIARLPRLLRLDFTETPELAFTSAVLLGPEQDTVPLSALRYAADSRRAVIAEIGAHQKFGTYTVIWRMAGSDGHPTRGQFTFIVRASAGDANADDARPSPAGEAAGRVAVPGQGAPPAAHHPTAADRDDSSFDASSPVYVLIRWVQFSGLLLIFGAIAFSSVVLGRLRRMERPRSYTIAWTRQRTARIALSATALVAVAAFLRLWAQSYSMHGGRALDLGLVGAMLTHTVWGWAWLAQVVGVLIAAVGFAQAQLDVAKGWRLATLGAAILSFTPALSGHAISTPNLTFLAVTLDAVHVIAAGGWLGSLFFVVAAGVWEALRLEDAERGRAVADLVNAFSPTALTFAAITVVTGAITAWLHLGSVSALWDSEYGQRLLLKLAILSIVVATGAYNWLRVRPRLESERGAIRLRRSASVELVVGLLVLLATAVLVATPTATEVAALSARSSTSPRDAG
jgi:copper transport protein